MDFLTIAPPGLVVLAGRCSAWASGIASTTTPAVSRAPTHASAAAVAEIHVHLRPGTSALVISKVPSSAPPPHPPLIIPTPQTMHPPQAIPPARIAEPTGLPPWLQTSSPPGFASLPASPVVTPSQTVPAAGAHDFPPVVPGLAEAAETAGRGVLTGVAILGALLAGTVTSSGQVAR
jgi:hypothetical protein